MAAWDEGNGSRDPAGPHAPDLMSVIAESTDREIRYDLMAWIVEMDARCRAVRAAQIEAVRR